MLGIYVHVPFCSAICNYCNFNRGLFDEALKARYVEAVCREIGSRSEPVAADSIFFGGGTPSLLTRADVGAILEACRGAFDVTADAEITLEANPESVSVASLEGYRAAGVNRLSFGVQSFRDEELSRLTRLHTAGRAREAVREARAAGFDNLSLDLMMWLPRQTVTEWLESVDALIDVGPDHASLYMLEVYPNAPLKDLMSRSGWSLAPDDDVADMYVQSMERLERAGFEQDRDLERRQAGAPFPPQPEVLAGRGMARYGAWRAFDARRRPLAQRGLDARVHRLRARRHPSGGGASRADAGSAHPGGALHRASAQRWRVACRCQNPVRRRRLVPLWPGPSAVRRRGLADL